MATRTYPDSNVLISGGAGSPLYALKVVDLLTDISREFVSSDWVKLEVLPKPTYNRQISSLNFYRNFFSDCVEIVLFDSGIMQKAFTLASNYGLSGFDALHIAAAVASNADEFITLEKRTKPIYRVKEIPVIYLLDT